MTGSRGLSRIALTGAALTDNCRANALKFLGKQHLTAEVIIPGGLQALLLETELGRLLVKQIHAQVSDCRHDGGCVALAEAAFIFSKHHI